MSARETREPASSAPNDSLRNKVDNVLYGSDDPKTAPVDRAQNIKD